MSLRDVRYDLDRLLRERDAADWLRDDPEEDDDGYAPVCAPVLPKPLSGSSAIALPESDDLDDPAG